MAARSDIDALKIFEKLRKNEAENLQKIKNTVSTQDLPVLKTKSVLRLAHF